jgi:putative oxidoreductase
MTNFEKEMVMDTTTNDSTWAKAAVLIARLLLGLVFLMAFAFKVMDINMTAGFIESAGFPFAKLLAVLAALFELAIVLSLFTGAYFSEMLLLGAVYVVFLAFAFHGPSHWTDDKGLEFGGFISHFPFAAGMLFAAAHGPGRLLAMSRSFIRR